MSAEQAPPPCVLWAQRNSVVLLTICLEDCKKPELKIEKDSIFFRGVGGTDMKPHEVTIDLYEEIDPDKCKTFIRDRNIELILAKKNDFFSFWPHLTKTKQKYHWLKVDFNKWRDENDSDGDPEKDDLEEMMKQMGGLAPGDRPKVSFEGLEIDLDSDDEPMPDLE